MPAESLSEIRETTSPPRTFFGYIGSNASARTAYSVAQVCITWYVFASTHSAVAVGIVALVESLAATSVALPAGFFVDRFNRGFMLLTSMLMGLLAFSLLTWIVVNYGFSIYPLIALVIIWSAGSELFRSSSNSILPDIVGSGFLPRANGVNRALSSTVGSVSSVIAGGLIIAFGVVAGFAYSAIGFALASAFIALIILPAVKIGRVATQKQPLKGHGIGSDLKDGMRWLLKEKGLLQLTISATAFNFFYTLSFSFLVVYIASAIHSSSFVYGLVLAVYAAGYVFGSLIAGYLHVLRHSGKIWVIVYGLCGGIFLLLLGIFPSILTAIFFNIAIGIAVGFSGNVWLTSAQNIVPSEMRGRYFAIDGVFSFLGGPPAIAVGAVVVSIVGITKTFELAGIFMVLSALVFLPMGSLWNLDGSIRYRSP
jgi:MFS family permease